jgi:hypothetical protein
MKLMTRPSPQFVIAAIASVLAMSAFALSSPAIEPGHSGGAATLVPAQAEIELPQLPSLLPR